MNNLTTLAIAIVLGLVAAGLNFAYLASQTRPSEYLALNDGVAVKAGDPFPLEPGKYKAVPIVGNPKRLNTTLILNDEKHGPALVLGATASRDLSSGELIFFSDIAGDIPRYDRLGPFTLLSVGEHLTGTVQADRSNSGGTNITVEPMFATEKDEKGESTYHLKTRRLLQIVEAQKDRNKSDSTLKIIAIDVLPSSSKTSTPRPAEAGTDATSGGLIRGKEHAIIVPIDNVASIPQVIQIGAQIEFVVPAYP